MSKEDFSKRYVVLVRDSYSWHVAGNTDDLNEAVRIACEFSHGSEFHIVRTVKLDTKEVEC